MDYLHSERSGDECAHAIIEAVDKQRERTRTQAEQDAQSQHDMGPSCSSSVGAGQVVAALSVGG